MADMLFSAVFKTYTTISGRRFASDLREARTKGFLSELPHYNSVARYLESEALTLYLEHLITASSLPLKSVETDFAVDSSGFATAHFLRWCDAKYGREMQEQGASHVRRSDAHRNERRNQRGARERLHLLQAAR
ncbi:MAG TPA: hypothetical protein VGX48_25075 [Pyrinomonadaceae bacterium]|jgi:hypothetical protein|nr:hypothetical protein [Pyrinomonadaceae bacterium]